MRVRDAVEGADLPAPAAGVASRSPLGSRLRAETRGAHIAAEAAFDLDRRLASLTAYIEGLRLMAAFGRLCAPAAALAGPSLGREFCDGHSRRRSRLRDDLVALGAAPAAPLTLLASASASASGLPGDLSPDHALGVVYVQEGAALGGLRIAAEVRRRLPAAASATTFFTGEGRATADRWRRFQAILGAWNAPDGPAADRVVAGAHSAFAVLAALCESSTSGLHESCIVTSVSSID